MRSMACKPSMEVKTLPMEQLRPLLDEQLEYGEALLPVTGNSMWPMLSGGRDLVRLARLERPVRPGDVALYRRSDGSYILHRVIRVKGGCVCCGDNQWERETVSKERMLAYVTAFCRKGRWRETERSLAYRLYVRLWVGTFPLRRPLLKLLYLLRRVRSGRFLR